MWKQSTKRLKVSLVALRFSPKINAGAQICLKYFEYNSFENWKQSQNCLGMKKVQRKTGFHCFGKSRVILKTRGKKKNQLRKLLHLSRCLSKMDKLTRIYSWVLDSFFPSPFPPPCITPLTRCSLGLYCIFCLGRCQNALAKVEEMLGKGEGDLLHEELK